jgi:hypothetical protein
MVKAGVLRELNLEETMKKGTKIKFVDPDKNMVSLANNDDLSVYLKLENIYTVAKIDTHCSHTIILLNEMPGRWFNDLHFEEQ